MSELNLTKNDIEEFLKNPVWLEMVVTLDARRKSYLEDLATANSIENVMKIQGCINEIDYNVHQPDFILLEIQDDEVKTEPGEEPDVTEG